MKSFTFVQNPTIMLKLIFWGVIGYIVYRYFQMKEQLKEGRRENPNQQHIHHQAQTGHGKDDEGDFIDYEELK